MNNLAIILDIIKIDQCHNLSKVYHNLRPFATKGGRKMQNLAKKLKI